MRKREMTLRSEEELLENERAIYWLYKKGIRPCEIRYIKWQHVDYRKKILRVYKHNEKDINSRGKLVKIRYANSPLLPLINRGQEGKTIYILSKYHPKYLECGFQPLGFLYTEDMIRLIIREKSYEKPLTLWSRFGRIEVSKVNITK